MPCSRNAAGRRPTRSDKRMIEECEGDGKRVRAENGAKFLRRRSGRDVPPRTAPQRSKEGGTRHGRGEPAIPARQPARSRKNRQEPAALAFRGARPAHERTAAERLERDPVERVGSRARVERHGETTRKKCNARNEEPSRENLVDTEMIEKSARTRHEDRCRERGKPAIEMPSPARNGDRRRDRSQKTEFRRAAQPGRGRMNPGIPYRRLA